ncbi:MAG: PrsW family glutamic-type intramembrane protease [Micromonosporaceae bacterium]
MSSLPPEGTAPQQPPPQQPEPSGPSRSEPSGPPQSELAPPAPPQSEAPWSGLSPSEESPSGASQPETSQAEASQAEQVLQPEPPTTSTIGMREFIGAAMPPKQGRDWKRIVLISSVVLVLLVGALIIVWQVGSNLGPGLFFAASAISLLPVPFLVFFFLWLDRFDPPSSWRYPALAFAWGACVATALSLMVNTFGSYVFAQLDWRETWVAVFVAPVIEEITKAMAPLLLFLFRRREVLGIPDAVMYAGLSAAGFAMTENVLYLGGVYISGEQLQGEFGAVLGVVSLVVVRLGFTGFIHPLFTALTGIGIGLAARTGNLALRFVFPLAGLLGAMLFHGVWNFMATQAQRDPRFLGYVYFLIALPVLFGFLVLACWARTAPGRAIRRLLPEYVRAGWLSPPELGSLVTLRRRLWARRWAQKVAGADGVVAMRGYQIACTKLALLREARGNGVPDWEPDPEAKLLGDLAKHREVFGGRDPSVPGAWWDGRRYRLKFPDGKEHQIDPPRTLVMPVPALAQYPWTLPPAYAGQPGYGGRPGPGGPGYGGPGHGGPGYGGPPGYGGQSGYGGAGHGGPPGYGGAPPAYPPSGQSGGYPQSGYPPGGYR